jgi:hypothetical protein
MMMRMTGWVRRLDKFCARLNDGLAAVALMLLVAVLVTGMAEYPVDYLPVIDAEMGPLAAAE